MHKKQIRILQGVIFTPFNICLKYVLVSTQTLHAIVRFHPCIMRKKIPNHAHSNIIATKSSIKNIQVSDLPYRYVGKDCQSAASRLLMSNQDVATNQNDEDQWAQHV